MKKERSAKCHQPSMHLRTVRLARPMRASASQSRIPRFCSLRQAVIGWIIEVVVRLGVTVSFPPVFVEIEAHVGFQS
ncbi:hypothetical protein BKA82DRAFT_1003157 [Pisolithus tinctorius]|uniref:Uncharacterized protein n=1 Tax=Pisolithus tinctorius Marx 270 TaxID=870435 RepID=A0A0C3P1S2_PISTI|nr:hypothetical protein BKA82DRAFT_1003157 [Pisolithus tinctorius]KIO01451.1 hypothetical protein M404DRAFT_1003157 [Pisolithus tinctorius Marx 270]